MAIAQSKNLTAAQIIKVVKQLPPTEFEKFAAEFNRLRSKPKEKGLSKKETELIAKINKCKPSEEQNRYYYKLVRKRRNNTLTEDEYQELLRLTDEFEGLNVERIKNLIELAKIRKKTLDEVMDQLGIKPAPVI